MKPLFTGLLLVSSLFGKACMKDPHFPEQKCGSPVSDVPEPSTFLLLGGALCIGAALRRKA